MVYLCIEKKTLNVLTFLSRTLGQSALLVLQLHSTYQKLIQHVLTHQKHSVSVNMYRLDLINCQISIDLKQYLLVSSHSHYFRTTAKKYQLVTWLNTKNYSLWNKRMDQGIGIYPTLFTLFFLSQYHKDELSSFHLWKTYSDGRVGGWMIAGIIVIPWVSL